MKIIISPAKKMNIRNDDIIHKSMPVFLEKANNLRTKLSGMEYEDLKQLWSCNDKIAEQNYERIKGMDLNDNLTPALLAYEGIAFQYMGAQVFTREQWDYVNNHLTILSGFYGILRPLDGISPYRLEMQARLAIDQHKNLYDYWGDNLYKELTKDGQVILNLASKEYSKVIENYMNQEIRYVTCVFGELVNDKIKIKATMAKMARGEMVRWLSECNIQDVEGVKGFDRLSFVFSKERSTDDKYVFIKKEEEKP